MKRFYNYTDEDVIRIIPQVRSYTQACQMLGIPSRGNNILTIKRIVIKYSLDTSHFKYRQVLDDDLIKYVPECNSYAELARKIKGIDEVKSSSFQTLLKKRVEALHLDTSHFTSQLWSKGTTYVDNDKLSHKTVEDFLYEGSKITAYKLKLKLIKEGFKEHKCEMCHRTEWNGKPIPIQLHHINGVSNDNRLENLMILCPNCHAQTDTYCSKNLKNNLNKIEVSNEEVIPRVYSDEEIEQMLKDHQNDGKKNNVKKPVKKHKKVKPAPIVKRTIRFKKEKVTITKTGKHLSEEAKQKQRETFAKTKHQQGEKNSQYGTCWVTDQNDDSIRIKKEQLDEYLDKGYKNGRVIKNKENMGGPYGVCYMTNPETHQIKRIEFDEIDSYLQNGWIRGRFVDKENT